jgi:hypothetical protein
VRERRAEIVWPELKSGVRRELDHRRQACLGRQLGQLLTKGRVGAGRGQEAQRGRNAGAAP